MTTELSMLPATGFPVRLDPKFVIAARKALRWSRGELAKRAGVGVSTLAEYEGGRRVPMPNNMRAILRALGAAGIEFLLRDSVVVGVRWPDADAGGAMAGVVLSA